MAARDYWDRMLVYFGIAEEAYDDEPVDEWDDEPTPARRSAARATGRDDSAARSGRGSAPARRTPPPRHRPSAGGNPSRHVAGVGVVPPRTFNDAQGIADQLKRGNPVIVDLQSTDAELAKRLIDFASGLTYGLDGRMQRIADKVFLLTPPDVEVTAEEQAAMVEDGFFNQS